jgi:Na+/melibiose symporter-like transporter
MEESRDPSRGRSIDWAGAGLAVLGLGGIVLGLLEWPPLGPGHPIVIGSLVVGVLCLALLILVEDREKSPMLPLRLFRNRTFTLANLLTLLLYGALGVVFFLVPLVLIQVGHYSATEAGGALVPFAVIMFALSRWSGGLVKRVGPRLPLTIGPALAAVGIGLFAMFRPDGSYWTTVFPAVCLGGLGMAITVAPLTTTVMGAVDTSHSGVASGVNNSVSRVAGLLAIAVFGVLLARTFDAHVTPMIDALQLPAAARADVEKELPKMGGAELKAAALDTQQRVAVQRAIDEAFVSGFRVVVIGSAVLALAAAGFGAAIGQTRRSRAAAT